MRRASSTFASLLAGIAAWAVAGGAWGQEPKTASWFLPDPHPAKSVHVEVPSGTSIFARLETAISTTGSRVHSPVTARVVREVSGADGVSIPAGAVLRGRIETLVASSNSTERAQLLVKFTKLEIPGQKPVEVAAHLTEVENARESVLPSGAIQGVLENEVPVSLLRGAFEKWKKSDPEMGAEAEKQAGKYLGKPDTSIAYAAGTDLDLTLDKPLELGELFEAAVPVHLSDSAAGPVQSLLADAPQRAEGKEGKPGDPLNLVIVGSEAEIRAAFGAAGWAVPERGTGSSILATVRAAASEEGYGKAPVSDLYLYGQRENLAFEKMLNTFKKRHHLRLWRSPVRTADGREVWLGAATHDNGLDVHPGVVSHAIDPDLDLERAKVAADLIVSGHLAAEALVTRPNPLSEGLTATGAPWKTDGRLLAIELKP